MTRSAPQELPIACSLSAGALEQRLEDMAALGEKALVDVRAEPCRAQLRFAGDSRARVEAIAAAESECCAFLALAVTDEPGSVVLTIDAPAGAEPVLAELVAAFSRRRATA